MSIAQNFPTISPSLSLDFANVQALDPRITYTRASTATYYGTETAVAEQNLLAYSQQFDDAYWTKIRLSASSNTTTAPDGTTTADSLIENTDTNTRVLRRSVTTVAGTHVFSVFAKANTRSWIYLSSVIGQAWFDLTNGVVGTVVSGTASIQNLGNGWYRCVIVGTATAALNAFDVGLATGDGVSSYTGDGTSGLFLWGAQLEQRSSVTAYTPTTTQPITNYIPVLETAASGVARFDHNPTTFESLGLLIEQQSTNLFTYSEQFDNAAWNKVNTQVTANTIVAPDGTLTGDKLVATATTAAHYLRNDNTTSLQRSFSVYAKAAEESVIALGNAASSAAVIFNLSTGTVTSVPADRSAIITPVGNGWYRCTFISLAGTDTAWWYISLRNNASSYTGDGYSGVYIWGAQLEALAFSTSYIPTVASQVTRAADSASMTGTNFSSWWNPEQGSGYMEAIPTNLATTSQEGFLISNAAPTTSLLGFAAGRNVGGSGGRSVTSLWVRRDAANQALLFTSNDVLSVGVPYKLAFGYALNNFAGCVNGLTPQTDTLGILPTDMDRLIFGQVVSTNGYALHIRKLSYFPARLTNTNLVALTG